MTRASELVRRVLVVAGASALLGARPAVADWPPDGRAICTAPDGQTHAASAPDGTGGAILTWQDSRAPKVNLFAHHVLASGELDPAWPVNGRALVSNTVAVIAGGPFGPVITSDGAGGAFIAWLDLRDSTAEAFDIYAQHVLASGVIDPDWKTDGNAVIAFDGPQESPAIVSDGTGGAIVTWMDGRPGASQRDIYAQHLVSTGVDPTWPLNGLAVSTAPGLQEFPALVADGDGGAIVTWDDGRSGTIGFDIYAQHVQGSASFDRFWPLDGLALCTATGDQGRPNITSDGAHGAIVAWSDARVVGTSHIFAQHVQVHGVIDPAWPVNGRGISNAGSVESRPIAIPDGAGGAVITWQALAVHLNMYAQHVQSTGAIDPAWPAGGRALSVTPRQQSDAAAASDGAGGAIVTWTDSSDVVAQHVRFSGALDSAYPDTGRVLVGLPSAQGDATIVGTGDGGAIVAWTDTRSGVGADIFALQVLAVTPVGVFAAPPLGVSFARPSPNPARTPTTLRFSLPRAMPVSLAVYDAAGRRVRELFRGVPSAGPQVMAWDLRDERGRPVRSGLYLVRLEAEGRPLTQRVMALQ